MRTDYSDYYLSRKEVIKYLFFGMLLAGAAGIICYKSIVGVILLSPYSLFYLKKVRNKKIEERSWELNLQFRDCIQSISAALNTGYSIENAFKEALKEMKLLYFENAFITVELEWMVGQISLNNNVEDILRDFAKRSSIEDIYNFAEVFATAKRTGGDIIKVIHMCSKTIGDKIEVKREVITMMSAKRFEASIMTIVPVIIVLYLWIFSPGFMDIMYFNFIGILVMSLLLVGYYSAWKLIDRIIAIDV